ncbi:type II toxin-antitoxin system RelE/ParE family toxin [Treponema socranskii]|uniref:type II toxin-antitoxin system RelE family toxin n=1 Tax=Treponema socranskii TaxID=53419 RepID=UPI0028E40CBC|nr:type II toxin-antitoxin system RelE/ParE family toxin [Treponema socranskii]
MTVVFAEKAKKEFLKLDKPVQKQVQIFIVKLQSMKDPRSSGKALGGNLAGMWRYRVDDYRLVCEIENDKILITVLHIAHRKDVYR